MSTTTTNSRLADLLRLLVYKSPGHTTGEYRFMLCNAGLCYDSAKISAMLYTLKRDGDVEKWDDGWYITEKGEQKVKHLLFFYENADKLLKNTIESVTMISYLSVIHKETKSRLAETSKHKQRLAETKSRLAEIMETLSSEEKEVFEIILEHYSKWGSTWVPIEELLEKGYERSFLIMVLRKLAAKKLIYWYQRQGRVGLGSFAKKLLGVIVSGRRNSG